MRGRGISGDLALWEAIGERYARRRMGERIRRQAGETRWGSIGGVIAFFVFLILFAICVTMIVRFSIFLSRHAPDRFWRGEVKVSQVIPYNFGSKGDHGKLTVAELRGEPVLIVGKVDVDGWLMPEMSPKRYRKLVPGAEKRAVPVLEHFQMHPFVWYGFLFAFFGTFLVVTGLGCLGAVVEWSRRFFG